MITTISPVDLKIGDAIRLSGDVVVTVRKINKMKIAGQDVFWVFREPDGALVMSLHSDDTVKLATRGTRRRKTA